MLRKELLAVFLISASPLGAATFFVDRFNDEATGACPSSRCSLRDAITVANATPGADSIFFLVGGSGGVFDLSIAGSGLTQGDLDITDDLEISGDGTTLTHIDARQLDRVFDIHAPATVTIRDVTVTGGFTTEHGGGFRVEAGATLNLVDIDVVNNVTTNPNLPGGLGGGIANFGTTTVDRSTLRDNASTLRNGGAFYNAGTITLTNSTMSGNANDTFKNDGVVTLVNVTMTGNVVANTASLTTTNSLFATDCALPFGTLVSNGGNVESPGDTCELVDSTDRSNVPASELGLGPLRYNGGSTPTFALEPGSVAIDAALNAPCPTTDQRGAPRDDGACDVGAFEAEAPAALPSLTSSAAPNALLARYAHTATGLPTGEILVTGGLNDHPFFGESLTSAQTFDPSSGSWSGVGSLSTGRYDHSATQLADGGVLIAGGVVTGGGATGSLERYDPTSRLFTPVASCIPRAAHTATLLRDGSVLLVGGDATGESVEIYVPGSPSCNSSVAQLPAGLGRSKHAAVRLPNGDVLIMGGIGSESSVLRFNGSSWTAMSNLRDARDRPSATLLPDQTILLVGSSASLDGERYDPATGQSTQVVLGYFDTLFNHSATLLPDGRVLVAGGEFVSGVINESRVFDHRTGIASVGPLISSAAEHAATLTRSGQVLLTGGVVRVPTENFVPLSSAQLIDPQRLARTELAPSHGSTRGGHTSTLLPSGRLLHVGPGTNVQLYDPAFNSWSPPGQPPAASAEHPSQTRDGHSGHSASLLSNGRVLIAGGGGTGNRSVELYDPTSGTWDSVAVGSGDSPSPTRPAPLAVGRTGHTATLLATGKLLVVGGGGPGNRSVELYDPETGLWGSTPVGSPNTPSASAPAPLRFGRVGHAAVSLPSGRLLVAGGAGLETEIYDPKTGLWISAAPLPQFNPQSEQGRFGVLLENGLVLLGSRDEQTWVVYDEIANSWTPFGPTITPTGDFLYEGLPNLSRLPGGRLVVVGGEQRHVLVGFGEPMPTVLYDPASGSTTQIPMTAIPFDAIGTRLLNGAILVSGMDVANAEVLSWHPSDPSRQPEIINLPSTTFSYGQQFEVEMSSLLEHEASSGRHSQSASDLPVVELLNVDSQSLHTLIPDPLPDPSADPVVLRFSELPVGIDPGWHLLTVTGDGFASESRFVNAQCSVAVSNPIDFDVSWDLCSQTTCTATFSATSQGARSLQWQQCRPCDPLASSCATAPETCDVASNGWDDIEGAIDAVYTTPPLSGAEAGTLYRLEADSGCTIRRSVGAAVDINEASSPPDVTVVAPSGGALWQLSEISDPPVPPNVEQITWTMTDAPIGRICRLGVSLLSSEDGGATYDEVPGGELLHFNLGDNCIFPGLEDENLSYQVPTSFPSANASSEYRVRVEAWDQNTTRAPYDPTLPATPSYVADSAPFFIVQPGDTTINTLILWNCERMESLYGATDGDCDAPGAGEQPDALDRLRTKLVDLADFEERGVILDVGENALIDSLYQAWTTPEDANAVLFGDGDAGPICGSSPEPCGVHELVREQMAAFPNLRYLIVVGDDEVIPFARIDDRGGDLLEGCYPHEAGDLPTGCPDNLGVGEEDLAPTGTSVAEALASNFFLSDDPLTMDRTIDAATDLEDLFESARELAVGRLVESPDQINTAITTYINAGAQLNLDTMPSDHRVLVTGYDFLIDSANSIAGLWQTALGGDPFDPSATSSVCLAPGDAYLVSATWGSGLVQDRIDDFDLRLRGCAASPATELPYGILSLNGHATHHQEGVPGESFNIIEGLPATAITDIDLAGRIVYALGCHGGLPVPGTCDSGDPLACDLPEAFLSAGALAYVANTGYGWGLESGIGYAERLMELMTIQLTEGTDVTVGDAVLEAKEIYSLPAAQSNPYHYKTVMQWTTFGFPRYRVTRTPPASPEAPAKRFGSGPAPTTNDLPTFEKIKGVEVTRRFTGEIMGGSGPPPFVTRLELNFDLGADGIYQKFTSSGPIESGDPGFGEPGCPEVGEGTDGDGNHVEQGCYYRLNGQSTDESDRPIEPYLLFDSRLSGTSQHGILWTGAEYTQQAGWNPLMAENKSNGGDYDVDIDPIPGSIGSSVVGGGRRRGTGDGLGCDAVDTGLTTMTVSTGETLDDGTTRFGLHRLYDRVDTEILYFSEPGAESNCDRTAPVTASAGPYHSAEGGTISWSVPVCDSNTPEAAIPCTPGTLDSEVWRVLALYDLGPDSGGNGSWESLELNRQNVDANGVETWTGELGFPGPTSLRYLLQAVDVRGNARFLDVVVPEQASGADTEIVNIVTVDLDPGALSLTIDDNPDPVQANNALTFQLTTNNLSGNQLTNAEVTATLAPELQLVGSGGSGWACSSSPQWTVTCTRPTLELGPAPSIAITVIAPGVWGLLDTTASATALDGTTVHDAVASEITQVLPIGPLSVDAGPDQIGGVGIPVLLGATPTARGGSLPYSYQWTVAGSFGGSVTPQSVANPLLISTVPGIFDVTVQVTDGNSDTTQDSARIAIAVPLDSLFVDGFESGMIDWSAIAND